MFIGGEVNAPITIDQGVLISSLRAAQFNAPIVIETYLKGEVIATSGGISSLDIGNTPHPFTINSPYFAPGFMASMTRPDWDPSSLYPFPLVNQDPECAREARSIIRARTSIGYLNCSQVVQGNKLIPAMIESPRFDVLRIGSLEYGVIWSGNRPDCTPRRHSQCPQPNTPDCECTTDFPDAGARCGPDPSDAASYASFGDVEIGNTVGRVFAPGYPEYDTCVYCSDFDRFDLLSRHTAHLRFERLVPTQHLRIGCAHGWRDTNNSGQIFVHERQGLEGQITVNAYTVSDSLDTGADSPIGNPDGGWWERVTIPAAPGSTPDPYVLTSDVSSHGDYSSPADIAPYYDRLSSDLGGGSIGQAPTHLHDADCTPACSRDPMSDAVPVFLGSEFCHNFDVPGDCGGATADITLRSVVLSFYDFIAAESGAMPFTCTAADNPAADYTPFLEWQFVPAYAGGPSRRLRIWGNPLYRMNFVECLYVIRPNLTGSDRLLCDRLMTPDATPIGDDFVYYFIIHGDCNRNGVWDYIDATASGWPDADADGVPDCCQGYPICDPDYNQDGNADQDDVAYMATALAGGGNPSGRDLDFNRDGNADQDDYTALINRIGGGACP